VGQVKALFSEDAGIVSVQFYQNGNSLTKYVLRRARLAKIIEGLLSMYFTFA
jgi:hypothetical protein